MKLKSVRVTNFRSIEDSNKVEIGDLTCLVGKNEAGKTALLHAIYGLNPMQEFKYDQIRDYPRRHLNKYDERHPDGMARVIESHWQLEDFEVEAVEDALGSGCLKSKDFVYTKSMNTDLGLFSVQLNHSVCISYLLDQFDIDPKERKLLNGLNTTEAIADAIEKFEPQSEKASKLLEKIKSFRENDAGLKVNDIVFSFMPKLMYTSHYERMSGEISIEKLALDVKNKTVSDGDQIFLDFLEYAGTSIEELSEVTRYEELKAKCEGSSNEITDEIFEFWSQNDALEVTIELGQGKPGDLPPYNSGTVAKIRINNRNHRVTVPLSERSAGFVWFFSFLSQFKQLKKSSGNAILLLDEPGLTLHGKAQSDLLRYIQERLLPEHQVIFTTHSPFMVPADRLSDVRIVEDKVRYDGRKPIVDGTKVSSDVLSVDKETLFPLQAHLGYEITQSLFIGKNTLLVEGPSDILYLQAFSGALKRRGRHGLSTSWTICPAGGIDKILTFASLFGGNKLNIATLCDYGTGDKKKVERLRESEILNSSQVFTAADFSGKSESDIEDLLTHELYAKLLNEAYELKKDYNISSKSLDTSKSKQVRVVKAAEDIFRTFPSTIAEFDHFTPSDYLIRHPEILDKEEAMVDDSLVKFEAVFETLNKLLPNPK